MFDARKILAAGGLLMALATIAGALGAHALQTRLAAPQLAVYETAVRYQFFHALGLLAIGLVASFIIARALRIAAALVLAGVLCFSGSLYLLAFGINFGLPTLLGLITPLGGVLLISGWIAFALAVLRQ